RLPSLGLLLLLACSHAPGSSGASGDGGTSGLGGQLGPAGPRGEAGRGQILFRDASGNLASRAEPVHVDARGLVWTLDPATAKASGIFVERVYYPSKGCAGPAYVGLPNPDALGLIEPRVPFLLTDEQTYRVRPDDLSSEELEMAAVRRLGECSDLPAALRGR